MPRPNAITEEIRGCAEREVEMEFPCVFVGLVPSSLGFYFLNQAKMRWVRRIGPWAVILFIAAVSAGMDIAWSFAGLGLNPWQAATEASVVTKDWLPLSGFCAFLLFEGWLVAKALFRARHGLVTYLLLHSLTTAALWLFTLVLAVGLWPGS